MNELAQLPPCELPEPSGERHRFTSKADLLASFASFSGWDTHELVLMMAPEHATYTGCVLECGHSRDIGVSVQRTKAVTEAMEEKDRESLLSEMNDGQLL
jgi:hypothetical protein